MALSKRTVTAAVLATMRVGFTTMPGSSAAAQTTVTVDGFNSVDWAVSDDNSSPGNVVPSSLSISDSCATAYAKANAILRGLRPNPHANTVRRPLRSTTVPGTGWSFYLAVVDAAVRAIDDAAHHHLGLPVQRIGLFRADE